MDAERWKRVDGLLQSALQMPAEQQEETNLWRTSHTRNGQHRPFFVGWN